MLGFDNINETKISWYLLKMLPDSTKHSPSWEANSSSASQDITCLLWNPKVYHRVHNSTPPVILRTCVTFWKLLVFYGVELFGLRSKPTLQIYPLSAVQYCLLLARHAGPVRCERSFTNSSHHFHSELQIKFSHGISFR
jgi:hypothetical protein